MPKSIFAISGSLRKKSFNTALLRKIEALLGERADVAYGDIGALPHYNEDVENAGLPESVTAFKDQIGTADALMIATPEYNYSVPGVLKNAIDWASRPGFKSVLAGKRIGIVSASMAGTAGARAQGHLKRILGGTLSDVIVMPDVAVAAAHTIVGEDGDITDEATLRHLGRMADALVAD